MKERGCKEKRSESAAYGERMPGRRGRLSSKMNLLCLSYTGVAFTVFLSRVLECSVLSPDSIRKSRLDPVHRLIRRLNEIGAGIEIIPIIKKKKFT